MENRVNIGKSMQIKGEVTGSEDLVIEGKVDGKICLKGHKLSIGPNGCVTAAIRDAKDVIVSGEMIGNISANDRVEISSTGTMRGDIKAPRVVLADGAQFKGCIDMAPRSAKSTGSKSSVAPAMANSSPGNRQDSGSW